MIHLYNASAGCFVPDCPADGNQFLHSQTGCPERSEGMDPHNLVFIGFGNIPQQVRIRPDEFRSALTKYPEDFRRFHPDFVIRIMQELLKHRHGMFIDIGCVCGDIFRSPDEAQPHLGVFVPGKAEQVRPVLFDDLITASAAPAECAYRTLPQKRHRTAVDRH